MIHPFETVLHRLTEFSLLSNSEEKQLDEFLLYLERKIGSGEQTEYMQFIAEFNRITNKKYFGDAISRKLFYDNLSFYSLTERITAVQNALTDDWIKGNITILTPQYILKNENTAKYINYRGSRNVYEGSKGSSKDGKPASDTETDYTDAGV